jgi:hypothetical protein
MARAIRFHLDENCDPRVAAGLRLYGIDVTTSIETGLLQSSDEDQLMYAAGQGRVIVTRDADFLRLDTGEVVHSGIVYWRPGGRPIGDTIRKLVLIWQHLDPGEMRGHVEYL